MLFDFCFEKISKENAKIIDLGLPKSSRNALKFASFLKTLIFSKLSSRRGESSTFEVWSLPKAIQNRFKIDSKNMLIFNFDFFSFWTRFWSLLGFQIGAKLALKALENVYGCLFGLS